MMAESIFSNHTSYKTPFSGLEFRKSLLE